jgi:hypothetical protein
MEKTSRSNENYKEEIANEIEEMKRDYNAFVSYNSF